MNLNIIKLISNNTLSFMLFNNTFYYRVIMAETRI